MEEVKKMFFVN